MKYFLQARRPLVSLLLVLVVSGCSNFKSSRTVDMGPFAENTIHMLGQAEEALQPLPWNHLREYRTHAMAEIGVVDVETVRAVFRGIGFYSVQVVTLNGSKMSDKEKSEKLAKYIAQVCQPIVDEKGPVGFKLSQAELDSVATRIAAQTSFLDALKEVEPLADGVVTYSIECVQRIETDALPAFQEISVDLSRKFAEDREEMARLKAVEEKNVACYLLIQDYRGGETAALDSLLALDPSLGDVVNAKSRPSPEALAQAEKRLMDRLVNIDTIRSQLTPRREFYEAQMEELASLQYQLAERGRIARVMMVYWMRSHSNLAQGLTIPPHVDITSILESSAKRAAKDIVP